MQGAVTQIHVTVEHGFPQALDIASIFADQQWHQVLAHQGNNLGLPAILITAERLADDACIGVHARYDGIAAGDFVGATGELFFKLAHQGDYVNLGDFHLKFGDSIS